MRHMLYAGLVVGAVLAGTAPARAEDDPAARAVVEKAIKAHGGDELAKLKAITLSMKGKIHTMGLEVGFTGEIQTYGPDKLKLDIEAEAAGQKVRVINVLNGDKGWSKLDKQTMDLDKDQFAEAKEQAYAGWVVTLVPLKGKEFTLTTIGETKIGDRPAVGVKVSSKDHRDIDLYFDKETGLLVKNEHRVKDESGTEVNEESFYFDYKDVQGTKQAMKFMVKRDGKIFMEGEAIEYVLAEKLDASVFAKP